MDKKCILIIDDDIAILTSLKALLEMNGFWVDTAKNGREAMMRVCNSFYNLALIDIRLPDMEGTELLLAFQQLGLKMKKIVITGYSTEECAIDSLNLGADGYLKKPVMPGKLLDFVANKLAEQEAEDTLYEDTVNYLLGVKAQGGRNMDRWSTSHIPMDEQS